MTLHYYGILDSLESCYTFQRIDMNGYVAFIQNSTRFGYEKKNICIQNPALFVLHKNRYYRFDIEGISINVSNGVALLSPQVLNDIHEKLKAGKWF